MEPTGLEAVFLDNRNQLLRFLAAQGAGDAAEDLLQELWIRVSSNPGGPIATPLSYLYRAANNLMLDHYRSSRQAVRRDVAWSEVTGATVAGRSDDPSSDRILIGRERAAMAHAALDALGPRPARIFRRHRIDGIPQRQIAGELGVSLSTVESDLRLGYRAMSDLRRRFDEG